jgi:hypothetical protein
LNGMVNKCELPLNVVTTNKPKMLTGLNQKVRGRVSVLQNHRPQMQVPPAERQDLTYLGIPAERGKPVSLPWGKANRKVSRWRCG